MTSQRRQRFLKERGQAQSERIAKARAWAAEVERMRAPPWAKAEAQAALARALGPQPDVRCRATAKGTGRQCRNVAEPGHWVCKFHGGRSTGARTAKGKARSLAALQAGHRRWRKRQRQR
jgi:hypothetical protein